MTGGVLAIAPEESFSAKRKARYSLRPSVRSLIEHSVPSCGQKLEQLRSQEQEQLKLFMRCLTLLVFVSSSAASSDPPACLPSSCLCTTQHCRAQHQVLRHVAGGPAAPLDRDTSPRAHPRHIEQRHGRAGAPSKGDNRFPRPRQKPSRAFHCVVHGTRHGRVLPCRSRDALARSEGMLACSEETRPSPCEQSSLHPLCPRRCAASSICALTTRPSTR